TGRSNWCYLISSERGCAVGAGQAAELLRAAEVLDELAHASVRARACGGGGTHCLPSDQAIAAGRGSLQLADVSCSDTPSADATKPAGSSAASGAAGGGALLARDRVCPPFLPRGGTPGLRRRRSAAYGCADRHQREHAPGRRV